MKSSSRISFLAAVIVLGFGLALLASDGFAPAKQPSPRPAERKYRMIIYPYGVPARTRYSDGAMAVPEYLFLAEARIPKTLRTVVLCAEKFANPLRFEDSYYRVLVALIDLKHGGRLIDLHDITTSINTFTEVPGNFMDLDGIVSVFRLPGGEPGVNVSTCVRLSGTGGISEQDDQFYRFDDDGKLVSVLELLRTGGYWRSGFRMSEEVKSRILVEKPSGDKLIIAKVKRTTKATSPEFVHARCTTTYEVWRYVGHCYVPAGSLTGAELKAAHASFTSLPRISYVESERCK